LRTQIVARDDHPAPEDAREFRFEVLSHFAGIEADRRLFVEFKRDDATDALFSMRCGVDADRNRAAGTNAALNATANIRTRTISDRPAAIQSQQSVESNGVRTAEVLAIC
jgi:hypothetical protein